MDETTRRKEIYRVTFIGSFVNMLLLIFKFVAGFVGHSAAMIADAVHSLSDFVTDIIVIVFVRISSKPVDSSHNYGHGKYETLATAIIGLVLLGVAAGLFIGGAKDVLYVIRGGILEKPGTIALVAAGVSVLLKELIYQYTVHKGKNIQSQALIANAWHHRSDAFSSIGTLFGIGGAILGGVKWRILDPLAAIVVSLFIARVAVKILKGTVNELLEHSLPASTEEEIRTIILSVEGVTSPHHLRTRRIGYNYAIDVHIRMDGNKTLTETHLTTSIVEKRLKERYGAGTYVIIHTEPEKSKAL
ncbi:MAG: cation transporter [Bacteroidaceae bacterium]|nr:cation transporter [Bacteroidaceae bacterium]